jgi:methionine-rich copper-binding protein CopC
MFSRCLSVVAAVALAVTAQASVAQAHALPKSMDPAANARMDTAPAHISITYDSPITSGSSMVLRDSSGNVLPTAADAVEGNTRASISPTTDLAPGPYTVAWTSVSGDDGHTAQGFYTFVVNGGPVGILNGNAQSQAPAADLSAGLTLTTADDGGSLLRVDLNNPAGVERVRIRLSGPDLGEDLLDTQPSGDGGWVLNGNEVAVPGQWHAQVIVRRQNIFDDATGSFDFTVDPASGAPSFASASTAGLTFGALRLAHAQYASSTPAAGSTVQSAPQNLAVTWTQELAAIQFTVNGPDGSNVVNGPAQINLEERHTATVPLRDAGPGQYFVLWHNVSGDDGDPNDGSFVFTVAGPPAQAAPAATPAPAATITTSPPSTTTSAPAATSKPPACVDNGVKTPGIADARADTYCKRQAIRDQYYGKIDVLTFNYDLSIGMGLESSLKDAMSPGGD